MVWACNEERRGISRKKSGARRRTANCEARKVNTEIDGQDQTGKRG